SSIIIPSPCPSRSPRQRCPPMAAPPRASCCGALGVLLSARLQPAGAAGATCAAAPGMHQRTAPAGCPEEERPAAWTFTTAAPILDPRGRGGQRGRPDLHLAAPVGRGRLRPRRLLRAGRPGQPGGRERHAGGDGRGRGLHLVPAGRRAPAPHGHRG
ncbi:unnamed protein product, partial [Prorocentrum cordatum]